MTKKFFLSFRILTSLIFVYAAAGHLLNPGKIHLKLSHTSLYESISLPILFHIMILLSGVVMLAGAICVVINYKLKHAAIALLFMLIPITLSVQLENLNDLGPFFKNVAIAGSLLVLIKTNYNEIY